MVLTEIGVWLALVSGLGIFLFGMYLLEDAVRHLAGSRFHHWIQRFTTKPFYGILTGTIATFVLQSSSAVTLMLLAFTGSGLLGLSEAIGVVLGANLGTSLSTWLVTAAGFSIRMEDFAIPMAGLGGLGLILTGHRGQLHHFCRIIGGLGFIFLGIGYMKDSMSGFTDQFDPAWIADWPGWAFLLTGVGLTLLVQSSTAGMTLALSMLHSGMFDLNHALFIVIGTNIGSSITSSLGAIGALIVKKQVALAHFLFNVITGGLVYFILNLHGEKVTEWLLGIFDPLYALAFFHTGFNLFGTLLFAPFLPQFTRLVEAFFSKKKKEVSLEELPSEFPIAGAQALYNQVKTKFDEVGQYFYEGKAIPASKIYALEKEELRYSAYGATLRNESLSEADAKRLQATLLAMRSLVTAARLWEEGFADETNLSENVRMFEEKILQTIRQGMEEAHYLQSTDDWTRLRHLMRQKDLLLMQDEYAHFEKQPATAEEMRQLNTFHRNAFQAVIQWMRAGRELHPISDSGAAKKQSNSGSA